jgi:hypothetical protein
LPFYSRRRPFNQPVQDNRDVPAGDVRVERLDALDDLVRVEGRLGVTQDAGD